MVGHPRPLSSPHARKRVAPFAALSAGAMLTVLLPPAPSSLAALAAAVALLAAIAAAGILLPWERLPASAQAAPAVAFLGVVVLLRHAAGGSTSGFSVLALLPIFWLALYGTRPELLVGLSGSGSPSARRSSSSALPTIPSRIGGAPSSGSSSAR